MLATGLRAGMNQGLRVWSQDVLARGKGDLGWSQAFQVPKRIGRPVRSVILCAFISGVNMPSTAGRETCGGVNHFKSQRELEGL